MTSYIGVGLAARVLLKTSLDWCSLHFKFIKSIYLVLNNRSQKLLLPEFKIPVGLASPSVAIPLQQRWASLNPSLHIRPVTFATEMLWVASTCCFKHVLAYLTCNDPLCYRLNLQNLIRVGFTRKVNHL